MCRLPGKARQAAGKWKSGSACEDRVTSKVRSACRCLRMHCDADKEVRTSSIDQGRRSNPGHSQGHHHLPTLS